MIFNTVVGLYELPPIAGLVIVMLSSYAVTELFDRDFAGPFGILATIKNRLTGGYCPTCATFWVALLMMSMPAIITVPLAAIGFRFVVDYILSVLEGK